MKPPSANHPPPKTACLRLMRLYQPAGIWLLLWPCWWSLALSRHGNPDIGLMLLFGVGAVVMRSAGCVVNDLMDRDFDAQVARTRTRPLASGEISVKQAIMLLAALLGVALVIALQLNLLSLELAAASLVLVALYPLMKRITFWPQAFLGLTFNWGALLAWAAARNDIATPALLLYAGGFFWTLGYDTIYAHQDKEDDIRVGVKSTALALGNYTKPAVAVFYAAACICWWFAGKEAGLALAFRAGIIFAAGHFLWQILRVRLDDPASCLRVFKSNIMLGAIVFAGTGAVNTIWYQLYG